MLYISCKLQSFNMTQSNWRIGRGEHRMGGGRGGRGPSLNDPQRKLKKGGGGNRNKGGIKKENFMIFLYFGSVYGRACVNIYIFSIFTRLGKTHIKKVFFFSGRTTKVRVPPRLSGSKPLVLFITFIACKWYNELSQKTGFNLYHSRHCALITYSVKTWVLKILSV